VSRGGEGRVHFTSRGRSLDKELGAGGWAWAASGWVCATELRRRRCVQGGGWHETILSPEREKGKMWFNHLWIKTNPIACWIFPYCLAY
jgi:hypothetical protein